MDASQAGAFFDLKNLLTYQNVLVIMGAWFIVETLKLMTPKFWLSKHGANLLRLMPMIVCQGLVWVTIKWQPDASVGERILLGIVLGGLTAHSHDILKQFGLQKYVPVFGKNLDEIAAEKEAKKVSKESA